jgi:hypothetical protein
MIAVDLVTPRRAELASDKTAKRHKAASRQRREDPDPREIAADQRVPAGRKIGTSIGLSGAATRRCRSVTRRLLHQPASQRHGAVAEVEHCHHQRVCY